MSEQHEILNPHTPPTHLATSFVCPFCHAFTQQRWIAAFEDLGGGRGGTGVHLAECLSCRHRSVWYQQVMIFPHNVTAPPANTDLPTSVREAYDEAGAVLSASPRAASAMLRLAIERLVEALGTDSKDLNLNMRIGALVQRGLPSTIQQALDITRVVGNNAVHAGQIDMQDTMATALTLFRLVNLIAHQLITLPREIQAMYADLPLGVLQQIERRDNPPS